MSLYPWRHSAARLALASLLIVSPRTAIPAQDSARVTLALVRTLTDSNAIATVIREAGPGGRTLIMLRDSAFDATVLATALRSLKRSRHKNGGIVRYQLEINVYGRAQPSSLTVDEQRLASEYVSRLRNARLEPVAGVGAAKAIDVPLFIPTGKGA